MMSGLTLPTEVAEAYVGIQHRSATLHALNTEQRIIELRAVPYDYETQIDEHMFEAFEKRAFARAVKDPERCKLWLRHSVDGGRIVGQALKVEDRDDGLWLETRVSKTPAGDELLTLADDGVLDEASIEFAPIREAMIVRRRGEDLVVRHRRAHLKGVAVVPHGAYGRQALVTAVRDDRPDPEETREHQRAEWLNRLRARTA